MEILSLLPCSDLTASGLITEEKLWLPGRTWLFVVILEHEAESLDDGLGHSLSSARGPFTYVADVPIWLTQHVQSWKVLAVAMVHWEGL